MFDLYKDLKKEGLSPKLTATTQEQDENKILSVEMEYDYFDTNTGKKLGTRKVSMEEKELQQHIDALTERLAAAQEVMDEITKEKEKING